MAQPSIKAPETALTCADGATEKLLPPFVFHKSVYLVEATTLRAASLGQLLMCVTLVEELSIFYHLHRRFFLDPEISSEYPNDFAQWVGSVLGNGVVAERLANLNLFRAATLQEVRREISVTLADYLSQRGEGGVAPPGLEFIFCQPRLVILSCGLQATTPQEFLSVFTTVESASIAYHLFEPKATPQGGRNDFAEWFDLWGFSELARRLDSFDPYLRSLEDNRSYLAEMIADELQGTRDGGAHV
ncbi:MAG: hypothetical protein HYZ50_01450 [Deltaproteobacteria bacterium]|nr:hypothetical protein [Deltaproteobacteria bacterium]